LCNSQTFPKFTHPIVSVDAFTCRSATAFFYRRKYRIYIEIRQSLHKRLRNFFVVHLLTLNELLGQLQILDSTNTQHTENIVRYVMNSTKYVARLQTDSLPLSIIRKARRDPGRPKRRWTNQDMSKVKMNRSYLT
jgi:hypothetical protein